MYHPEITRQLGQLREVQSQDLAARERALANAGMTHRNPAGRRLALALVAMAPIVLVMVWALVVR